VLDDLAVLELEDVDDGAAAAARLSLFELGNFSRRNPRNALSPSGPSAALGLGWV